MKTVSKRLLSSQYINGYYPVSMKTVSKRYYPVSMKTVSKRYPQSVWRRLLSRLLSSQYKDGSNGYPSQYKDGQ